MHIPLQCIILLKVESITCPDAAATLCHEVFSVHCLTKEFDLLDPTIHCCCIDSYIVATVWKKVQGSELSGPVDGLDEILKGFEDLNGTVPPGSMPELPESDDEDPLLRADDLGLQDSEDDNSEEAESLHSDGIGALDDVLGGELMQVSDEDEVGVDFGDDAALAHHNSANPGSFSSSDDDEELHQGIGALMPGAGQRGSKANAQKRSLGVLEDDSGSGEDGDVPQLLDAVQQDKQTKGAASSQGAHALIRRISYASE